MIWLLACASPKEQRDPMVDSDPPASYPEDSYGYWCFVAGTRIDTPSGPRAIEDLQVGDAVWAFDLATLRRVQRPVTALHRNRAATRRVEVGQRVIQGVSAEHPFWSDGRWVPAGELRAGDPVHVWSGAEATERRITRIVDQPGSVEVFNLTVAGEHTYFAEGILVHNKSDTDVDSDMDTDIDGAIHLSGEAGTDLEGHVALTVTRIDDGEVICNARWPTYGVSEAECDACVFAWRTGFEPAEVEGTCYVPDGSDQLDDRLGLYRGIRMGWAEQFPYEDTTFEDVWVVHKDGAWRPWAHGTFDGETAIWSLGPGEALY